MNPPSQLQVHSRIFFRTGRSRERTLERTRALTHPQTHPHVLAAVLTGRGVGNSAVAYVRGTGQCWTGTRSDGVLLGVTVARPMGLTIRIATVGGVLRILYGSRKRRCPGASTRARDTTSSGLAQLVTSPHHRMPCIVGCYLININKTDTLRYSTNGRCNPSNPPSLHRNVRIFPRCCRRPCRR